MVRRSQASYRIELQRQKRFGVPIAGVDEAGRGPWAGPVVAAAVILDPERIPNGIADSKALSPDARERLYGELLRKAHIGIGIAEVARIDRDNILAATLWAMAAAVAQLPVQPALTLVDGKICPPLDGPVEAIVKGDASSLSIAAASIIAKVTRDALMIAAAGCWPEFGFEQHKGYGTKAHAQAITKFGLTPLHRRSFKPIQLALAGGAPERTLAGLGGHRR